MRNRIVKPIASSEVGRAANVREVRKTREYADWVCSSIGGGESQIVRTEPRISEFYRVKSTLDKWRAEIRREDTIKKPLFKD